MSPICDILCNFKEIIYLLYLTCLVIALSNEDNILIIAGLRIALLFWRKGKLILPVVVLKTVNYSLKAMPILLEK